MPNDELAQILISGGRKPTLSPERLEMMGKEAAHLLFDKRIPLTESITKLAGEIQDINVEQVKRICEFANTAAHLTQHDLNKTAGADFSYPQFDLADPARVFQNLSGRGRTAQMAVTDVSYSSAPEKQKVANAKHEAALSELFGAGKEKVAHATVEMAADDLISAKQDLTSLHDHLASSGEKLDLMRKEAAEELYNAVKDHLLEGESFADVMNAASQSGVDSLEAIEILTPMVERLVAEKVASIEQLSAQNSPEEIEKVAHRVLNEDHPLVKNVREIALYDGEIEKVAEALREVDEGLKKVTSFIRESFLAS